MSPPAHSRVGENIQNKAVHINLKTDTLDGGDISDESESSDEEDEVRDTWTEEQRITKLDTGRIKLAKLEAQLTP